MESLNFLIRLSKKIVAYTKKSVDYLVNNEGMSSSFTYDKLKSQYGLMAAKENEILKGLDYDILGDYLITLKNTTPKAPEILRLETKIKNYIEICCLRTTLNSCDLGFTDCLVPNLEVNLADLVDAIIFYEEFKILYQMINSLDDSCSPDRNKAETFIKGLQTKLMTIACSAAIDSNFFETLLFSHGDKIPELSIDKINELAKKKLGFTDNFILSTFLDSRIAKFKKDFWRFFGPNEPLNGPVVKVSYNIDDIFEFLRCLAELIALAPYMDEDLLNSICSLLEFGVIVGKYKFDTSAVIEAIHESFYKIHNKDNIK